MELELLEQISDDQRDFSFALMIYGGDVVHLKATILSQVADGLIEVWKNGSTLPASISELKAAFAGETLFVNPQMMARWTITVTEKGVRVAFG